MRHAIDPKVDCVFKAVLGSEQNSNLLIHFLNSFLGYELLLPSATGEALSRHMEVVLKNKDQRSNID